jgi:hypothetical protein
MYCTHWEAPADEEVPARNLLLQSEQLGVHLLHPRRPHAKRGLSVVFLPPGLLRVLQRVGVVVHLRITGTTPDSVGHVESRLLEIREILLAAR